jgi:hypothetical protein
MDMPHQFLQRLIFLTYDGVVSVLEKLTMAPMSPVERHRISHEQSSHQTGNAHRPASKQKMGVIRQKGPCTASGLGLGQKIGEPFNEVFTILIIVKYLTALYSSDHDVM